MKKSLGAGTLLYPMPVLLVGTYDLKDKPNLMVAAWGGICCSQPPCVAVSLRKATYSHACIVERKAFTVGVASQDTIAEADYCGIYSGRTENKFFATGLTPVRSKLVDAPFADEIPMVLECRLLHTVEIGLHTQFIGEIMNVQVEETALGEDGNPDIMKIRPLVFDFACKGYHSVGPLVGEAFSIGKRLKK